MALKKPGSTGNFFLLLCGHPVQVNLLKVYIPTALSISGPISPETLKFLHGEFPPVVGNPLASNTNEWSQQQTLIADFSRNVQLSLLENLEFGHISALIFSDRTH